MRYWDSGDFDSVRVRRAWPNYPALTGKGRPQIKPSGMQAATEPATKSTRRKGRRGSKRAKLTIDETTIVRCANVPDGARCKG